MKTVVVGLCKQVSKRTRTTKRAFATSVGSDLKERWSKSEQEASSAYHVQNSPYPEGGYRSDAEQLIDAVPPIVVDGYIAVCDGGGGALGHPLEFMQLDTIFPGPVACQYCGLRYISSHNAHGSDHH